jgi:hypothetical protein
MLNLDRVEQLLSRLMIRHRDTGLSVPFALNPNQKQAMQKYRVWMDDGNPLRVICVKSRRVGFSKLSDGILFAHAASNPLASNLIVAHQYKSSVDLFQDPVMWSKSLPFALPDGTKQVIKFNHSNGESTLKVATAGSVSSGRGLTLSALHLSEAAYYPGQDSFTSLLPTVSARDPNSVIIIESTANGKSGPGEIFYEYWQAAVEGKNGYLPVFLCFLNDPECVRDEEEAEDAPATDIERELMAKPYFASKAQIAWYRYIKESLCHGQDDTMLQEFPHEPSIAFLTSGDPAFSREELILAHKEITKPKMIGQIEMCGDQKAEFLPAKGPWHIWDVPDGHSWYYFGVDAARGVEHGDFGCIKIINGHTGRDAARLAERVDPERLLVLLYGAIHYYGIHPNTVNIELTGNLGWVIQKGLRDGRTDLGIRAMSYVLHSWKPTRDDRQPGKNQSTSLGWETTYRSRERMIIAFRTALRSKRCILLDEMCVAQMENAERSTHLYDFEVKRGHDDVFMAHMLAWICREDHAPPRLGGVRTWAPEEGQVNDGLPMDIRSGDTTVEGCVKMMLASHQKKVESIIQKVEQPRLLEGI